MRIGRWVHLKERSDMIIDVYIKYELIHTYKADTYPKVGEFISLRREDGEREKLKVSEVEHVLCKKEAAQVEITVTDNY